MATYVESLVRQILGKYNARPDPFSLIPTPQVLLSPIRRFTIRRGVRCLCPIPAISYRLEVLNKYCKNVIRIQTFSYKSCNTHAFGPSRLCSSQSDSSESWSSILPEKASSSLSDAESSPESHSKWHSLPLSFFRIFWVLAHSEAMWPNPWHS